MKRTATKRSDKRVEKTRLALHDALLGLIAEKGYDRTTVDDVLERADVGRATFYAHYYNKKDLLLDRLSLFRLNTDNALQSDGFARMPDVTYIFAHVGFMRPLYLALRGTEAHEAALAIARQDLVRSFERLLNSASPSPQNSPRVTYQAQFLTGALLHLINWWLEAEMPATPREMNDWFSEFGQNVLTLNAGSRPS